MENIVANHLYKRTCICTGRFSNENECAKSSESWRLAMGNDRRIEQLFWFVFNSCFSLIPTVEKHKKIWKNESTITLVLF